MKTHVVSVLGEIILVMLLLVTACGREKSAPQAQAYSEVAVCDYRKDVSGGFSHKWVAYVIEPGPKDETKDIFVELNGNRLGPYARVSEMFEISPDGEHIAFAALKNDKWFIVVDGQEKWAHTALCWPWCAWSPTVEGNSFIPQTQAAALQFSPDGRQIAYPAETDDGKWAVFVNGKPGQSFKTVGHAVVFVGNRITYHAWGEDGNIVKVYGNKVMGPYETSTKSRISDDGQHCFFTAENKGKSFLVVDGVESEAPGEILHSEIGPSGQIAYAYRAGNSVRVRLGQKDLPNAYDEVTRLKMSPNGQHIAFWARQGDKWSVVTDTKTLPGFDGYYFYQSGAQEYAVMWGPESSHVAYFARKGGKPALFLEGEEMPRSFKFPGLAFTNYVDDKGISVGTGLMQGPSVDPQAFVKCLILRDKITCDPFSAILFRGELAYIEKSEDKTFMVAGTKREGPYGEIRSTLLTSPDGKHYCYVIVTDKGQQVVIDGEVTTHIYEAVYRPHFGLQGTFDHLAVKDGKMLDVTHPLIDK